MEKLSNPTILVIEYELTLNALLVDALQMEFAAVVHAVTTGRSALKTARMVVPTIFIIDCELPDMDAAELSDRLHAIKHLEHIPTILIDSRAESLHESKRYLVLSLRKPFLLQNLYQVVKQALAASVDGTENHT